MVKTKSMLFLMVFSVLLGCQEKGIITPDAEEQAIQKVEIDKQTPDEGEKTAVSRIESSELVTITVPKAVLEETLSGFATFYSFHLHRNIKTNPEDAPCIHGADSNGEFVRCDKGQNAGQKIYSITENFTFKKNEVNERVQLKSQDISNGDAFKLEISAGNQLCQVFSQKGVEKTAESTTVILTSADLKSAHSGFNVTHSLTETSLDSSKPILHGQVTDASGNGVSGATITIEVDGASEPIVLNVKSDSEGFYLIKGLRADANVEVAVKKDGYKPSTKATKMQALTEIDAQCDPANNKLDFQLKK